MHISFGHCYSHSCRILSEMNDYLFHRNGLDFAVLIIFRWIWTFSNSVIFRSASKHLRDVRYVRLLSESSAVQAFLILLYDTFE